MSVKTAVNCLIILLGAAIMLVGIVQAGRLAEALAYVREGRRRQLGAYLLGHRALMVFFFVGYLVVAFAFASGYKGVGETFVSLIFLFGAIFVLVGIFVQSRLLAEVRQTLQGILPICAKCKQVRVEGGAQEDPKAWKALETYISERAEVRFSHGYCPSCYEREIRSLDAGEGKA